MRLNERRQEQYSGGEGPITAEIDLLKLRGYVTEDPNSYAIAVVDQLYGLEKLAELQFGFQLAHPGSALKSNMPPDQVYIVERKSC